MELLQALSVMLQVMEQTTLEVKGRDAATVAMAMQVVGDHIKQSQASSTAQQSPPVEDASESPIDNAA